MRDREARRAAAWDEALAARWGRVFEWAGAMPWESRRARVARAVARPVVVVGMVAEAVRIRLMVR